MIQLPFYRSSPIPYRLTWISVHWRFHRFSRLLVPETYVRSSAAPVEKTLSWSFSFYVFLVRFRKYRWCINKSTFSFHRRSWMCASYWVLKWWIVFLANSKPSLIHVTFPLKLKLIDKQNTRCFLEALEYDDFHGFKNALLREHMSRWPHVDEERFVGIHLWPPKDMRFLQQWVVLEAENLCFFCIGDANSA